MEFALKTGDTVIRHTLSGRLPAKVQYIHRSGTHARVLFMGSSMWEEDVPLGELRRPWEVRLYGSGTINVCDGHDSQAPYLYTIIRSQAHADICQRIRHELAVGVCAWLNGCGPYPQVLKRQGERKCNCYLPSPPDGCFRPGFVREPVGPKSRGQMQWVKCSECKGKTSLKVVRRIDEETIIADIAPGAMLGEFTFGIFPAEFHLVATGPVYDADPPSCNWKPVMTQEAKDSRARLVDLLWMTPQRTNAVSTA